MASTSSAPVKRKLDDEIVDPDTRKPIEDAKKPRIELDSNKKFQCISAIVDASEKLRDEIFNTKDKSSAASMETDEGVTSADFPIEGNITVGNHIISIIFTLHNVSRQRTSGVETNMIKKTTATSFNVHYKGGDHSITTEAATKIWLDVLKHHNLEYKGYEADNPENWYGTMGPYLDMFAAYALRTNELRLGHNNMPISKKDGKHVSFPVSKYGLSGAHHVLLEGTSFPPERRSSIVQSLGPMTVWLSMVRSEGRYRQKYASAVKRAMAHIPCIDEIIEITKTNKQATEISTLTTLIAEILLVTTSRQATRMFFPIAIFAAVWKMHQDKKELCNFFSTTGAGGWYIYKIASESNQTFSVCGSMEEEKAAQIVFHSIFGTFREDLSILSQITNIRNWYTREQMGSCFRSQGTSKGLVKITLPKVIYYAKMACANQTGLLSGVYNQVAIAPCFSGKRVTKFDESFFEHIEKKRIYSQSGKTISQIINVLTSTLEELHSTARLNNGSIEMGTTSWRSMSSLGLGRPGEEVTMVFQGTSKMFLGRN